MPTAVRVFVVALWLFTILPLFCYVQAQSRFWTVTISPEGPSVVNFGSTAQFFCNASSDTVIPDNLNITVEWNTTAFAANLSNQGYSVLGNTVMAMLDLLNVDSGYCGVYTCILDDMDAEPDPVASTSVRVVPLIVMSPLGETFIIPADSDPVNVTFNCTVNGGVNSTVNITWNGPSTAVTEDLTNYIVTTDNGDGTFTSELTIIDVTEDYTGDYTCSAYYTNTLCDMANVTSEPATLTVIEPPEFVEFPQPLLEVDSGTNVTIICSISAALQHTNTSFETSVDTVSSDSISVTMDDMFISYTLTLFNVNYTVGGEYTCSASNEAGNITNTTLLYIRPTIIPLNVFTQVNDTVMLECSVQEYPEPTYRWRKMEDEMMATFDLLSGSGGSGMNVFAQRVLVLDVVMFGDEGSYLCEVTTEVTGMLTSDEATVTVSPSSSVEVTPPIIVSELGDSVMFNCTAQGGPNNTFQWIRNGEVLDGETAEMLTLTNVTASDGGVYTCVVTNAAGDDSDSSTLYIRPYLVTQPGNEIFTSFGQNESFICADGFPTPTVIWERVESGINVPVVADTVLSFLPVNFGDEGIYQCVANATIPGDMDYTLTSTSTLFVSPVGSVTILPSSMTTVEQGENITFMCLAEGGPNNTFQWMKDSDILADETEQNLTLTNITASDGGVYTCVVTNGAGDDSDSSTLYIRPYFITEPDNEIFTSFGQNESFICEADGFPTPTVIWERVDDDNSGMNMQVVVDTVLSFLPVNFGDEGVYQCVANATIPGDMDYMLTSTSTLFVSPAGTVTVLPSSMTIAEQGENITFMCLLEGGPNNAFQWMKDGDILDNENEQNLTLTNVNASDGGVYTCVVTNVAGNDSDSSTLYIRPYFITEPMDILTDIGFIHTFTCEADGFPTPNITWFNVGTGQQVANGSELSFETISYDDAGRYQCVATSVLPDGTSLNATVEPPSTLYVSPVGSVNVTPSTNDHALGDNVTLTCGALGGPDNTLQWSKDGVLLINETENVFLILTITNIDASDGGLYTCIVSNPAGSGTASTTLNVQPYFTTLPQTELLTNVNTTVSFTCEAEGFPTPSISWQKLSSNLTVIGEVSNVSELLFDPVQFGDEGNYQCMAISSGGIFTEVYQPHSVLVVSPSSSVEVTPPIIVSNLGDSVMFNCTAQGGPNNIFQWTRNGEVLDGETAEMLTLTNVNASDSGVYACVVANAAGFDSDSSTLYIRPHLVTVLPSNMTITEQGENITFMCLVEGGPNNTFQWMKDGDIMANETEQNLTLTDVTASDGGVYTCIVTNAAGNDSDSSTLYISPYFITEPMDILTDIGIIRTFTCEADGFPTPNITWFNVSTGEQVANGSELSFGFISYDDAGRYQCVATSVLPDGTSLNATVEPPSTLYVSPQGSVRIIPPTNNHALGDNVTLTCRGDGGPDNTFQFLKDGVLLINGTGNASLILTLTNIDASDGGSYTCIVSNQAGSGTASTTLNVQPYFTTLPQTELLTNVNVTVNFTCEAEGFPTPSISWQKLYSNLTVIGEVSNVSELLFDPVQFGDEGNYQCMAISSGDIFTEVYQPHSVLVVSPFGSVSVTPVSPVSMVNNTITFMCSAQGGPDNTFQWMNDGIVIANETEESLTITDVVASDGGSYTCAVSNQAGNDSSTTILYVEPYIVTHPEPDVQVTNGTNVSLSCLAEAFPSPSYVWEKLNSTSGEFYVVFSEQVFEFTAMFGDEGTYRCIASINVEIEFTTESNNTTLTISPEGSVMAIPRESFRREGEMVLFTCSASGGPGNTFTWTRLYDDMIIETSSNLELTVESAFDGGDYQCTVTNAAGNDSSTVTLNVHPELVESPIDLNVTLIEGDIIQSCNATGFPLPTIQWYHNGSLVVEDNRTDIMFMNNSRSVLSTLTVSVAMTNDSGDYLCNATNSAGSVVSDTVQVLVQARPEQPQNVTAVIVNSRNIVIQWVEPHDNNAPILGYRVFYQQPDFAGSIMEQVNSSVEMANITDLYPGVDYDFTVTAFNEIGESIPSEPLTVRTSDEAPASPPDNVDAMALSSTSIMVSWEEVPQIDQNGDITVYEVLYVPLETFDGLIGPDLENTTDMMITLTDLEEFVAYSISVRAYTSEGPGPYSEDITEMTLEDAPVSPPDNVNAVVLSSTSIMVSWEEVPQIDQNGNITVYEVLYVPLETFDGLIGPDLENTTDMMITLTDLEEFVAYSISVRAYTSEGPGPYSQDITEMTLEDVPASPPDNVTANATSSTSIMVSWEEVPQIDQNGIITVYEVLYVPLETFDGFIGPDLENTTATMITLTDLEEFVTYNISVRAYTSEGPGPYSEDITEMTLEDVPGVAPTNVDAMVISSTEVNVTWTGLNERDFNGILTMYEVVYVYIAPDGEIRTNSAEIEDVDNSTFLLELTDLQEFTTYNITVRAHTHVGPGPSSVPVVVVMTPQDIPGTPPPPIPPDNDTITPFSATLRWSPPPPDEANGIILNYTINLVDLGFVGTETSTENSQRRKRQTNERNQLDECVIGGVENIDQNITVDGSTTSYVATDLTPYSRYEYSVRAETSVGAGDFSLPTAFSTPQDVPSEPVNLTVTTLSSSSLRVNWMPPNCDYGILINYTIDYAAAVSDGNTGDPPPGYSNISVDTTSLIITGLTPNTGYMVNMTASTTSGVGDVATVVGMTEEDAPQAIANLSLISESHPSNPNVVRVTISWDGPSRRNGSYDYTLNYNASQTTPYPMERSRTNSSQPVLSGDQFHVDYLIEEGLPFAEYDVQVTAVNIATGREGPSVMMTWRTIAINPSPVTSLTTVASSSESILINWGLPIYPNGPIQQYNIYYRQSNTPSSPPFNFDAYQLQTVNANRFSYNITGLIPFTNYTVFVLAVGMEEGGGLLGAVEEERLQRTNATEVMIGTPIPGVTEQPTLPPDQTVIEYTLPLFDFNTGPLIIYAVIVFETTETFDPSVIPPLPNLGPFDPNDLTQTYYITAAWGIPREIPTSILIGDGSITNVKGINYTNTPLKPGTEYAFFVMVEIMSDNNQPLITFSPIVVAQTKVRLGYSPAGLGIGIIIILCVIAGSVVGVVLGLYWYRTRYYKPKQFDGYAENDLEFEEPAGAELTGIHVFPNPLAVAKPYAGTMEPLALEQFKDHVKRMHANDDYLFSEEYSNVEPNHAPSTEATKNPHNAVKNRYANISAYDHSRVMLLDLPNKPGSDYINANFINGYNKVNAFIATQGPVPDSVPDFWRMVWEQGSATIVMLTNLEEKGRVKCHQYWPIEKSELYGTIRVHIQEVLVLADYTVRTLSLCKDSSKEERIVIQYHFTSWPDHGVPIYPTSLLHFVRKVAISNPTNAGPMVVHCSAGVGRTGTFITLVCQLKRIANENSIDVFNFVRSMRYNRCYMVQTEPQYIFIHDALLEAIECGITEVPARDLLTQYKKLGVVDDDIGLTGLEIEYDKLDGTIHRRQTRNTGTLHVNKPKNRYANIDMIPFDSSRCRLSFIPGIEGSDYINATHIDGYHKRRAFLATQGPLPDTTDDFWRMIWEQKCATIVMLTKEREGGRVKCHRYWPESGASTFKQFQVILHSVNEYPDYTLREFKIVDTKDGSSLPVKQFQYTGWPEEGVPDTGSGLIDLIGQVQKWQRSSGDKPIVVHCSGGAGRTGTFIATSILLERLKTEGVVDVFHTARALRLQRPGMIQTVDQYEFCYKTVLEYLDSFELYANFK